MENEEERLQELLERLETGEPVSDLLTEADSENAALLQLAAGLREIGALERNSAVVAAQRAQVLQEMPSFATMPSAKLDLVRSNGRTSHTMSNPWDRLPVTPFPSDANPLQRLADFFRQALAWLQARPSLAVAGSLLIVLILSFLAVSMDQTPADDTIAGVPLAPLDGDSVTQGTQRVDDEAMDRDEVSPGGYAAITGPTGAAPSHDSYLPMLVMPMVSAPDEAAVSAAVGLVEIQNESGDWTAVNGVQRIGVGQRVRTGNLSHASLSFYDGSTARLGPGSELSIDELHADPKQTRRIILTQWRGESEHEVAQVQAEKRTYRVDTPDGSGEAIGTAFQVRVVPGAQSFFGVLHGTINVTNVNVTVVVNAGELVIVNTGQPPADPTFRITGEGEVTAIGETWMIGGQDFIVDGNTIVVGDVSIGDYVFVEGHLAVDGTTVADRIVAVRPALEDTFAFSGEVSAIGTTSWTVAGQTISVDDETTVEPGITVGDVVHVEGRLFEDGELLATQIFLLDESLPFSFTGIVETIADDTWTISGVTVEVNEETGVEPGIEVGHLVVASGFHEGSVWVATTIELVPEQANNFSFTGVVDNVDPWSVAGVSFETREWTVIDEGIEVGDHVHVSGRILEDGTWVAFSILPVDEDALTITFVGTVDDIAPWIVNGLPLTVDDNSVVDPEIDVGDLVLVRAQRLAEGEWLALLIAPLDDDESFLGCFAVTANVVDWSNGELVLDGWPNVELGDDVDLDELVELSDTLTLDEDLSIGDALNGSAVTIYICVLPDDEIVVVNIIILSIVDDEPPLPSPPPPPAPPPPATEDKVTVCHQPGRNQHTLTIARPALSAHLGHGDYQGACR